MKNLVSNSMTRVSLFAFLCVLSAGCQTFEDPKFSEFTRSIDFSDFESFVVESVSVSDYRRFSDRDFIAQATFTAMTAGMSDLGYVQAEAPEADLFLSAKWQLVTALPSRERMSLDAWVPGTVESFKRSDKRYNLVVEVHDAEGMFWRYVSDERVAPSSLSSERARSIVAYSIARFPQSSLF